MRNQRQSVHHQCPTKRLYSREEGNPTTAQIRRVLPFVSIALFVVLAYDVWVFYSRWDRGRRVAEQRAEKEAADAKRTLELIGQFKILNFYSVPGVVKRGKQANLCYSVVGAKTVRLEPAVKPLYPALSYCLQVSPQKDTEYRLIAEDGAGHTAAQSLVIKVIR